MLPDQQLLLRDTKREELELICDMERGEAPDFIIPYSIEKHHSEFAKSNVVYKSVWCDGQLIGFFILVLEQDARSVEFRRIVVSKPGLGYGKRIVKMVDQICRSEFGRLRVWLDVFQTNLRARHVYEQCGYQRFGKSEYEGRRLLLYEKVL